MQRTTNMRCSYNLSHSLTLVNVSQVQKVWEDNSILPARVSAHTANAHFLQRDEEHFYLKAINATIKK